MKKYNTFNGLMTSAVFGTIIFAILKIDGATTTQALLGLIITFYSTIIINMLEHIINNKK